MYPRDAMEAALGLLFLWRVTRDEDLLYRARLFADVSLHLKALRAAPTLPPQEDALLKQYGLAT